MLCKENLRCTCTLKGYERVYVPCWHIRFHESSSEQFPLLIAVRMGTCATCSEAAYKTNSCSRYANIPRNKTAGKSRVKCNKNIMMINRCIQNAMYLRGHTKKSKLEAIMDTPPEQAQTCCHSQQCSDSMVKFSCLRCK